MAKKKAEATEGGAVPAKPISQREAVRRTLAAGKDDPTEGVAYVKEHFGITLKNNQAFSTLKSQLKKAGGGTPLPRGRRAATTGGGSSNHGRSNGQASPADLVRTLKGLIATYGAANVSDVLAVLAE